MKKALSTILLISLFVSCEFGSKNKPAQQPETIAQIPTFVDYRVESIQKKLGPCAQDSLSQKCVEVRVEYPLITGKIASATIETINRNIVSNIFDYAFISDKPETFESLIDEMVEAYEGIIQEFEEYQSAWSMEVTSDIIYQDSAFISVATTIYSYTGGAHPNQYQVYRSYDLQTGKALTLDDLLIKGYEEPINSVAEIEFRMLKEIPPNETLEERGYVFENGRFTLTDNFAIINKSLIFYYNSNEIAAYAYGPTELELKLTDYVNQINVNGVLNELKN